MLELIRDVMIKKVITVNPFQSVDSAIQRMQQHNIGGLPVVESRKLVGIITSRDVRHQNPNRLVCDAMTKEAIAGTENMTILQTLILMEENQIERLPILNYKRNRLVGIITKRDILSKLNGKEFFLVTQMIEQSEDKILNPLAVLNGMVGFLEKEVKPKDAKKQDYFIKIHNSIDRIKNEIRTLRKFRITSS